MNCDVMFVSRKVSASTQEKSSQEQAQQAQMAFKLYDRDKDGYITKAEMIKISKTLTKEQVEKVNEINEDVISRCVILSCLIIGTFVTQVVRCVLMSN